jgi:hypothetical protein
MGNRKNKNDRDVIQNEQLLNNRKAKNKKFNNSIANQLLGLINVKPSPKHN